jgi:hypothetical protein
MKSNFLRKQISRRGISGYSTRLAGSAHLNAFLFRRATRLLRRGLRATSPSAAELLADMRARFTGRYQTPESLEPKIGSPAQFWMAALLSCDARLRTLVLLLADTVRELIVFPRFLLGPLDVTQWLDFLVFHLARHRKQIERLRRHVRFPS